MYVYIYLYTYEHIRNLVYVIRSLRRIAKIRNVGKTGYTSRRVMNMQQNNKRNKQLHSAITKLFFLDSGGDSHELSVASYALELTPWKVRSTRQTVPDAE